ncbi:MAG: hypothetical protein ACJ796_09220 [Gemmatimonadaceae bacterium]
MTIEKAGPGARTDVTTERSAADYWIHVAIALAVTASYGWDAWIGVRAYVDYSIGSLTGIVWDVAVIALTIFLVRGRALAQAVLALIALAGLQGRWSMLTSVWFWLPNMDGRRTLVLMTTSANLVTLVLLAVPLIWRQSSRLVAFAAPRGT